MLSLKSLAVIRQTPIFCDNIRKFVTVTTGAFRGSLNDTIKLSDPKTATIGR